VEEEEEEEEGEEDEGSVVNDVGSQAHHVPRHQPEEAASRLSRYSQSQRNRGPMPPNTGASQRRGGAENDRSTTVVDPGAGYGEADQPGSEYEPNPVQVTVRTLPKYLLQILLDGGQSGWAAFKAMLVVCLLIILALVALSTLEPAFCYIGRNVGRNVSRLIERVTDTTPPITNITGVTPEMEQEWIAFRYQHESSRSYPDGNSTQWAINNHHLDSILDLEKRVSALEEKVGIHSETLHMLEEMLPHSIVVRKVDNRWEIPEHFWRALHERLSGGGEAAAPMWEAFLEGNKQRVRDLNLEAVRQELGVFQEKGHIITGKMFAESIGENFATFEKLFADRLHEAEQRMLVRMREEAESAATKSFEGMPAFRLSKMQAEALAYANLIKNTQDAMQNINYFSPGLGARVNPHGTSVTYQKGGVKLFKHLYTSPHPPIQALQRWEEAGDCWCAAPSTDKGVAQIEIMMGNKIYPESLVVEHVPRRGTLQIYAAPRELEVWMDAKTPHQAQEITKALKGDVQSMGRGACGSAPTPSHVCIGKGSYNIHHDNWVQSFGMFAPMEANAWAGDKVTIRVTSNWGANYTCLYRLRMTGARVNTGL